jgi:N-acetylglutamate synthase-like GNAT family acetyltransferase
MAARVFLETNAARKRTLQEHLAALLPEWFGKPESNAKYAAQAEILDGYVAEVDGARKGLLLLKKHGATSAEVYWMGVDPACHRGGLGRRLVEAATDACRSNGIKYLFVVTLHPSDPYEPYQRTRKFYEALGFAYVLEEQSPADPENPLGFYLKEL